ncbi:MULTISPECIES: hypothetical protein [Mycobacterium]|uniref:Uncharacterized protein n=1 Tax=Mycobacterium kiyosense TaxID=2871094 RepID=A0A9P3Q7A8_9MYCO|nr:MULTISPECIES: hypothetical protein [Mycobacterium]BDB40418.1 hypothetical protein IWGMT90018_08640 [Mycobacterium kiyosense]BDE12236.1 hypothetical protein MKCMC460_10960 [Mycobacterium sp. 20KCMC460]GLB86114.1 hypothetical protein SRL2020028_53700 [Mycobacterium kiyosense]GLB91578.1 hypothetical protein SRL2020130_43950 [Mycobacterium kiyosense]GLB95121.1 hypothetical protein SRL2020226_18970 [Mycobacterium kiyosense]
MLFLLVVLIVGTLIFFGLRAARAQSSPPKTRVIGPDDDPEFLRRLGDNKPR